jgi:hypothetical protein
MKPITIWQFCAWCGKIADFKEAPREIYGTDCARIDPNVFCSKTCCDNYKKHKSGRKKIEEYLGTLQEDDQKSELDISSMRLPTNRPTPKRSIVVVDNNITLEDLIKILEQNHVDVPSGGYHNYIKSEQWALKSQAMRKYFKTCAICDSDVKLCVHHKHYETVGRERLQDLTVLCGEHHWEYEKKRIEEQEGGTKTKS